MKFIHNDYLDECIRIGSKITWHFVCKMSNLYGTFTDRLCQVIFVRSLRYKICLISETKKSQADNIGDGRNGVNNDNGNDFIAVGFHADYQQCGNEEMEITEQKNQPNAGKRSVPPGIFPDEMTACIQKAFD